MSGSVATSAYRGVRLVVSTRWTSTRPRLVRRSASRRSGRRGGPTAASPAPGAGPTGWRGRWLSTGSNVAMKPNSSMDLLLWSNLFPAGPLCRHQIQHAAEQVLPGREAREVADARPAGEEEEAWQATGLRQAGVQPRHVDDRTLQRMDQSLQEGGNQVRQATTGLHGIRPSGVHHGPPEGIAMSSMSPPTKESVS